jgi:hypothetical protein
MTAAPTRSASRLALVSAVVAPTLIAPILMIPGLAYAADRLNILDYAPPGEKVDRTGGADASQALARAITAANVFTARGEPACIYVPPGTYRIATPPPAFIRAGCVTGDGPSQSILLLDKSFTGDLFAWSEAWVVTTPGPRVVGLSIRGTKGATAAQNALVFYDRNDEVFIDDLDVTDVHGRALYSGVTKATSQAYMRESHMRSLRFFGDGAPGVPVVEFNSQGTGQTDATNEIRMSQVDIYAPAGPGFVIRNKGGSSIRSITVAELRIEGLENGTVAADLLTIGDTVMGGNVNDVRLVDLELVDPYPGFAALRLTAPADGIAPYHVAVSGIIGGGMPNGQGVRIDAGRNSVFHFSFIHTLDTNVVIGPGVSNIILDGDGDEASWSYRIDPRSIKAVRVPMMEAITYSGK